MSTTLSRPAGRTRVNCSISARPTKISKLSDGQRYVIARTDKDFETSGKLMATIFTHNSSAPFHLPDQRIYKVDATNTVTK